MAEDFSDSKRKFLGYAIAGMAGAVALGYAVPLVQYVVKPALKKVEAEWAPLCCIQNMQVNEPLLVHFPAEEKTAWVTETVQHEVWVIKKPDGTYTAFSPICPHLGCHYNWDPNLKHFICPCHGSVFSLTGKVLGGPAPRPLDTLPIKVSDGNLYVKYERFRLGISEKELA